MNSLILRPVVAFLLFLTSTTAFGATFTVTTNADSGPGSLREALNAANSNPGADTIAFDIGAGGPQTIGVATGLPFIIDAVTIDGRTQPGFAGTPIITVRNTTVFPPLLGFRIARPGPSTIRSLVIVGFNTGISIRSDGATIVGNYVSSGAVPGGNFQGIQVEETSVGVIIGGPAPGDGNVITANERGITLTGPHGTTIQGNIIGLDPSGTAVGNGIGIFGGGTNTTIGGPLPGQGNVISGNARGVELIGAVGTTIQGNFIGTDITGSTAIPNDRALELYGVRTTIIGGTGSARNVISGNRLFGIALGQACTDIDTCTTPEDVVIAGNLIGTDHTGTQPLGNASHGILIGTARM